MFNQNFEFYQDFTFWQEFILRSLFSLNLRFSTKFLTPNRFSTKISFFAKNFDFRQKFRLFLYTIINNYITPKKCHYNFFFVFLQFRYQTIILKYNRQNQFNTQCGQQPSGPSIMIVKHFPRHNYFLERRYLFDRFFFASRDIYIL